MELETGVSRLREGGVEDSSDLSFILPYSKADVCYAYQILIKGGLKEENVIVFMYDDIAFNKKNPRPGVIINNPHGDHVYKGVLKDDIDFADFGNFEVHNLRTVTLQQQYERALAAATKTVNCLKIVHSIRAHFLLGGDVDRAERSAIQQVIFEVLEKGLNTSRCMKSSPQNFHFSTRRVDAIQKGNVVFTLVASLQDPEKLLSMEEVRERRLTDPRLPRTYRNILATVEFVPWPIEIRFCDPSTGTSQTKSPPSLRFWFRAKGNLSDDQALHRCVVAYASDLIFSSVSNNPHRKAGLKIATLSLDHSPIRADDWILFVIGSPSAHNARGFVSGQMFDRNGTLVVSLTQEALQRAVLPTRKPIGQSKL
ncbi:unnamed protein product [Cuscuta campestris]|uniref:Acyl-CoA thioesterase 2 C-terminal domain-containing protein n=1 Tax=Cuscuta campestris TaxID=132261 RepID=A0A484LW37_9ASTE|nr:unnamed protein product [Cuscuta campestris]